MSGQKIILDTAQGGYPCSECERILKPNEAQLILGDEEGPSAVCLECLDSARVQLW